MSKERGRARLALLLAAAAATFTRSSGAAEVATRWNAPVSGSWDAAARWSAGAPVATAPAGTTYAATIDATGAPYTVQLNPNSNAKAASVTLDSPDAILRFETGDLDVGRLIVRRGEILTSGSNVIRNATIEFTPGAIFRGNVTLRNVTFATDVTFTGGGTAFPDGLNTGGRTITFRHIAGITHVFPFGGGAHISGGGAIVSDAEHRFESMYLYAPGSTLTIDAGVEVRTGTGHIHVGPPDRVSTNAVVNNGTIRSGNAGGIAERAVELTNVTNNGLIAGDGGRIVGLNVANAGGIQLAGAGAGAGSKPQSTVDKLVNDGTIAVSNKAGLIVRGLDNRGQINVTSGARLGIYDESFPYGTLPLSNAGTISLEDAELELGVPMASDQVDAAFNRTGSKSLIVQARLENAGRTITVSPTNKLFVGSAGRIVGGTIAGTAGGLVDIDADDAAWGVLDGVTLAVDWTLPGIRRSSARVENGLTLANGATIRLGSPGLSFNPSTAAHTLGGNGRVIFQGDDAFTPPGLGARDFTIGAGVTVETGTSGGVIGPRSFRRDAKLVNAGTIRALTGYHVDVNAADFANSGTIELGGFGWITSLADVVNTGTIRGDGGIAAESFQSDGLIAPTPGVGLGQIYIGADTTLGAGNTLRLEIAGAAANTYDHFGIDGTLALGGTLHVDLLGGYVPAAGTTFRVLHAASGFTGGFAALELPALPGDLTWDTSALASAGRLGVVPEPTSGGLLAMAGVALAALSRRRVRG